MIDCDTGPLVTAALAERLNLDQVATLDRRHAAVVRPAHATALTLHPQDA